MNIVALHGQLYMSTLGEFQYMFDWLHIFSGMTMRADCLMILVIGYASSQKCFQSHASRVAHTGASSKMPLHTQVR